MHIMHIRTGGRHIHSISPRLFVTISAFRAKRRAPSIQDERDGNASGRNETQKTVGPCTCQAHDHLDDDKRKKGGQYEAERRCCGEG